MSDLDTFSVPFRGQALHLSVSRMPIALAESANDPFAWARSMLTADELDEIGIATHADAAELAEATAAHLDATTARFAPRIPGSSPASRGSKRSRRASKRR